MTNEEAKTNLEKLLLLYDDGMIDFSVIRESIKVAIEALERQIPKKPTIKTDKFSENLCFLYCPTCGSYVGMYNKHLKKGDFFNNTNRKICAKCGRSIDDEVE